MMVRKGQIWYAKLGTDNIVGSEQRGDRPCVIIQNDTLNERSTTVTVALVTKQRKPPLTTHFYVGNIPYPSIAMMEQVRTIDKCRLTTCIGNIPDIDDIQKATLALIGA